MKRKHFTCSQSLFLSGKSLLSPNLYKNNSIYNDMAQTSLFLNLTSVKRPFLLLFLIALLSQTVFAQKNTNLSPSEFEVYNKKRRLEVEEQHRMVKTYFGPDFFEEAFSEVVKKANVSLTDKTAFHDMLREKYFKEDKALIIQKINNNELNDANVNAYIQGKIREYASYYQGAFLHGKTSLVESAGSNSNKEMESYLSQKFANNNGNLSVSCGNIDFDLGSFSGWFGANYNVSSAFNCGLSTPNPMPNTGFNFTAMNNTSNEHGLCNSGVDPATPALTTVSPFTTGGVSCRLGDVTDGCGASQMSFSFTVSSSNINFTYDYAAILYDGHLPADAPKIIVGMIDLSTGNSIISCASYSIDATQAGAAGSGYIPLGGGLYYRPWSQVFVSLSNYIGKNVQVNLLTTDCDGTAHRGYAYFDFHCSPFFFTMTPGSACTGNSATLIAPAGASSYTWTTLGSGTIVGPTNTQSITATSNGDYQVTMTALGSGCSYTIDTTITVTTPPVPSVSFTTTPVCAGTAMPFTDVSTTNGAPPFTSWNWNFGNGGSSTSQNPSNVYMTPGTFTVSFTANNGCPYTYSTTVTVYPNPTVTATSSVVCNGAPPVTLTASGATTYTWNTGATGSGLTVIGATTTTAYTVTGSTINSCTAAATTTITVNPNPTVTVNNATICDGGGPVTLTANGAATYTWDSGANGSVQSVNPSATTNYTVTGSTVAGCTGFATTSVTVIPNPTITTTGDAICMGVTANLSANGAATYTWTGSNLVTNSGPNVTSNPTSTSTYTVIGTTNTCTATAVATVTLNPTPTLTVTNSTVCVGAPPVTLTASGAATYTWDSGSTGATQTVISPGATTGYTVTGSSAQGCTVTATTTITVNPNPTVTVNNATICDGTGPVTLTANGATTYTWDSGATGASLSTNPSASTNYTVTGANGFNCTNTATTSITVIPNPTVTTAGSVVCFGITANLNAQGATTYTWTGLSLVSNTGPNVTANPPVTATYTVIGTTNTCTSSAVATVTVLPTPLLSIANQGPFCPGDAVAAPSFTSNPNDPATTFSWINNNSTIGLQASGAGVPPAFTAPPNNSLAVMNATITVVPTLNGCVGPPTSYSLAVKPTPFTNHVPPFEYCPNKNTAAINFTSNPPGPTIFNWINTNNAIGLPSSGIGNIPTFLTVNTNSVSTGAIVHVVPTLNGCVGPDSTFIITIDPLPKAGFTYSKACIGDITHFTDESAIGTGTITNWNWDFNNDGIFLDATNQNPQTALPTSGAHQIGLTVTSDKGCKNLIYESVYVNPLPNPNFIGDNLVGCPVHPVIFTESASVPAPQNIISWNWDFGNGQSSSAQSPTIVYYKNGSHTNLAFYNVTLTVKTDSGCSGTITKPNYITVYPKPQAGFTWGPQDADILDPSIQFYNTSVGGSGNLPLHYYLGDVFIDQFDTANWSNLNNPRHTYTDQPYTYYVTQWVQNIYGCKDSVTNPIVINPVYTFYIPNAFSPNGDGHNEGFKGTGIGIDPETYNLWVFDRWGNQCFHSTNLEETWNGRVNERLVQEDVYVWKVRFSDMGGTKHELHGHVSIIK